MITTLRIDDMLKRECDSVLDEMGLSLSCAITIFLKELTRRRAMPFAIRAHNAPQYELVEQTSVSLSDRYRQKQQIGSAILGESGIRAKKLFAQIRQANDREWTLDEINAEIAAVRAERCN